MGRLAQRHVQLLALSFTTIINHIMTFSTGIAIIPMRDVNSTNPNAPGYDWPPYATGWIFGSYTLASFVFMLPLGYLSNRMSNRWLLSYGTVFAGVSFAAIPLVAPWGWFPVCVCRFLMGMFGATYSPCIAGLLSRWAPLPERTRMSSFLTTSSALGNVFGACFAGLFASMDVGWPAIFYIFGTASFVWGILGMFVLQDSPITHPTISEREKALFEGDAIETVRGNEKRTPPPWRSILQSLPLWAIVAAQFGTNWGTSTISQEMPTYTKKVLQFEIQKTTVLFAVPYVLLWLVGFLFSWSCDWLIERGVPIRTCRKFFNSVGMWGPALCLVLFTLPDEHEFAVAALMSAIVLKAGNHCGFFVSAIDISPNYAGSITSLIVVIGLLASTLAPVTWGYMIHDDKNKSEWRPVFFLAAGVLFVGNCIYLLFAEGTAQSWNDPNRKSESRGSARPPLIDSPTVRP